VKVDRLALFTSDVVLVELSIHLVRRCENKRRFRIVLPRRLEHVQSAARIDVEIGDRVHERRGHSDLARQMEDCVLAFDVVAQGVGVPHVLFDEGRFGRMLGDQPFQVALGPWAAEVVEQGDVPTVLDHADRGVDSEESRAAGDQDPSRRPAVRCARSLWLGSRGESGVGSKCGGRHRGSLP